MTTFPSTMPKREGRPAAVWVGFVLVLAWLATWIYQLSEGLQVTGLGQQVVWGLYIAGFFTAAGAAAGTLVLAVIGDLYVLAAYKAKLLLAAFASFVVAGILITMDVGSPLTLWRMVTGSRWTSMMSWDFWLLVVAVVVTVALFYRLEAKPRSRLGALAVLAAVLLVAVEGWMLSSLAARTLWSGGYTVLTFLLGAAIGGIALALLVLPEDAAVQLKRSLQWTLVLSLILVIAELASGLIGGTPRGIEETRSLGSGASFWLHVVLGILLPLVLLWLQSFRAAAALALLGVLLGKIALLASGQTQPLLSLPASSYSASLLEVIALIGVVALGALLYRALLRSQSLG